MSYVLISHLSQGLEMIVPEKMCSTWLYTQGANTKAAHLFGLVLDVHAIRTLIQVQLRVLPRTP